MRADGGKIKAVRHAFINDSDVSGYIDAAIRRVLPRQLVVIEGSIKLITFQQREPEKRFCTDFL